MTKIEKCFPFILFLGFFGLYLHSAAPCIPPYRDAGEMALVLNTLGVAHPPGYPLYTLIGHLFTLIPLGNAVYRCHVLSALAAAGVLLLLYLYFQKTNGMGPALLAVFLFGFSIPFWELATVTEMYTLGFFMLGLLVFVCLRGENPTLLAFLMGLGLAVRMDMLLLYPLFVGWLIFTKKKIDWWRCGVFFFLGFSIFLYMPIRSLQDPIMDWGNPDSLGALFNSLSRKSYSGTLDLLSLSYKTGENLFSSLHNYGIHFMRSLGWVGLVSLVMGGFFFYKEKSSLGLFFGFGFLITGPVYLFLANMPPNTHALAILEANYPVIDFFCLFFIFHAIEKIVQIKNQKLLISTGLLFLIFLQSRHGYGISNKRHHFYARDYAQNVFRSAPRGGIVVFNKDVQLFSLWEEQLLSSKRKDLSLISLGLSGSEWFWDMKSRWGTALSPPVSLKESSGWKRTIQESQGRPLLFGQETSFSIEEGVTILPHGMLNEARLTSATNYVDLSYLLNNLNVYRGDLHYGQTPDFFSSDLISDHARAFARNGFELMNRNETDKADWLFRQAETRDPLFPTASLHRGFLWFKTGDFAKAFEIFKEAIRKDELNLSLANDYKSLPDVVASIKTELSDASNYAGATLERLNRKEEARAYYEKATRAAPNAQAEYNLAVTYWNEDWPRVVEHLQAALHINPRMSEAQKYLMRAEYALQKGKTS